MFSLLETIIAFSVIMLILSLLVKSFTSIVKNHIDYYTKNLKIEVERFITGTFEKLNKALDVENIAGALDKLEWRRLGEEYLTKENMSWLLKNIGLSENDLDLKSMKARLEVHKANIRYAFEKRTKNIALALGLALCLFMNINAFSIWERLYNDQQVRAKFSSQEYVDSVINELKKTNPDIPGAAITTDVKGDEERKSLEQQRQNLRDKFYNFRGEVNFGIGKIYTEKVDIKGFLFEFFGSFLTAILISIGAPYWHDILRIFTEIRKKKTA